MQRIGSQLCHCLSLHLFCSLSCSDSEVATQLRKSFKDSILSSHKDCLFADFLPNGQFPCPPAAMCGGFHFPLANNCESEAVKEEAKLHLCFVLLLSAHLLDVPGEINQKILWHNFSKRLPNVLLLAQVSQLGEAVVGLKHNEQVVLLATHNKFSQIFPQSIALLLNADDRGVILGW